MFADSDWSIATFWSGLPGGLASVFARDGSDGARSFKYGRSAAFHAVVEDSRNPYLCTMPDHASLADAMLRLQNCQKARDATRQPARRKIEQQFREDWVIETYLDALAEYAPASIV